ncbi:hypothetical protein D3C76_1526640 [compost metagenome]
MLALGITGQRLLHFIHQQHIVNRFAVVALFGGDHLTERIVVHFGVVIEPNLTLHGEQLRGEAQILHYREHVLLFQSPLRVICRAAFPHEHTAQ